MTQQLLIPKTVSQPEGPGPSFLALVPELRNKIYERLVILPHPIRIPQLDNTTSSLGASSKEPYRSGVASVLGISETCRTIYHEAVGIFYARNTFAYELKYFMPDPAPFVEYFVGSSWSRFHYIHHVTIRWCDFPDIDLGPLVKICWARDDQKCIFSLISPVEAEQDEQPGELMALVNKTLRQLVADTFGIRQYHRQILSIRMDHISDRAEFHSQIHIRFGSHRNLCQLDAIWVLNFRSNDQFKTFERYDKYQNPNLICLPRRIKESIFKKVMCSCPIDVNVLGKSPISPDMSLLSVNREIAAIARPIFWSQNIFTYRMTQKPMAVHEKTSLSPLEAALCTKVVGVDMFSPIYWPYASRHVYENQHQSIIIEFDFHYDCAVTLADIRIDAKHLIRITSHLEGNKCFVRFKVSSTVDGVTNTEQSTITLRYIRCRILELLSQAISTDRRIFGSPSFDFDIDGNGEADYLGYNLESDERIYGSNSYNRLPSIEMTKRIYGSNGYNRLPSIEAVEAQYGDFFCQAYGFGLLETHFLPFTGKLTAYLSYLRAVADPSPVLQRYSDNDFAKYWFFTRAR